MNIAKEINSVIRKIATSGDSHRVVLERVFDTDAADLWNACTSPQRLSCWFEPVRGDLAPGGRYTLTRSGTEGAVLRCEPTRHLAITWEYQGNISHVDVDLIPIAEERTVLRLTHHVPSDDHWDTYGPGATGVGWEESLRALSLNLASDGRGTADALTELTSSHEDQELIRRAAHAWGLADQDAGASVNEAEPRALKTAAFYLDRARQRPAWTASHASPGWSAQ
jgi:uncharacterized protein YndB with AHSA1/START domain